MKLVLLIVFFMFLNKTDEKKFMLNTKTYQKWYDFIKPSKKDLEWTSIPWVTSFEEGVEEAIKREKPILLWVMNGHPLGCT